MSNHQVPSKLQRRPSLIIIFLRRRRSRQQVTPMDGRFVVVRDMHLQSVVFMGSNTEQVVFFSTICHPFPQPTFFHLCVFRERCAPTKQNENQQPSKQKTVNNSLSSLILKPTTNQPPVEFNNHIKIAKKRTTSTANNFLSHTPNYHQSTIFTFLFATTEKRNQKAKKQTTKPPK